MVQSNTPNEPNDGQVAGKPHAQTPSRVSGLAVTSLILSITGTIFICSGYMVGMGVAFTGLLLGFIAVNRIGQPYEANAGKTIAIVSIVASAFGIVSPFALCVLHIPFSSGKIELANRSVCASNLKGIHTAMAFYASRNGDQFPPTLAVLIDGGLISPKAMVCPSAGAQTDYVYVYPNEGTRSKSDAIILYEPLHHHRQGTHLAFGDGGVRWLPADEAKALLQAQGLDVVE